LSGVSISSSGLEADKVSEADKLKLPALIATLLGLKSWQNFSCRQTTQNLLDSADLIIFMNADIALDAEARFKYIADKTETWNILNLDEALLKSNVISTDEKAVDNLILRTYAKIHTYADRLTRDIVLSGIIDVVDAGNKLLGYSIPLAWTDRKGLWHRSCHGVIVTHDNKIVTEKRSHEIVFSPDLLDVSFGGGIDSGEDPELAPRREAKEELGITIKDAEIIDLGIRKVNRYYPSKKLYSKFFLYSYLVKLPKQDLSISPQLSEVKEVYLISFRQIARLVKFHRLARFGRLTTSYVYYRDIMAKVREHIKAR
jgi:8-oxo-dGTP pyrophosphatase MutT (NUDIX family)